MPEKETIAIGKKLVARPSRRNGVGLKSRGAIQKATPRMVLKRDPRDVKFY